MAEEALKSMHIGQVAEATELSHRTIRHYDEMGLVTPSGRSDGGFRLYTEDDVQRLLLIRRMKPLGYSIDEMKQLLGTVDVLRSDPLDPDARGTLRNLIADTTERRARLAGQLSMADEFIALLAEV